MISMLANSEDISLPVAPIGFRQKNRQLSVLLDISDFLSTKTDLSELLYGVLDKIMQTFDFEAGRIYLMHMDGDSLYLAAYRGMDVTGLEKVNLADGFTGKSARTRSFIAQHVSELEDRMRARYLESMGLRYIICVPLITMDRVTGVMNLATGEKIGLDRKTIDLLTTIGNQIAVSVNNLKLAHELRNQIQVLKDKKEMVKFFAYSVSHDLRSPAVGIYGLVNRLQENYGHLLDEKGRTICGHILQTSGQILQLVERINEFIRSREVPLSFERFSLREVFDSIREEFIDELERRRVRWRDQESLPKIVADRLAITRSLRNLVENALKYGGRDMQELRFTYREDAAFHILSVTDDGVGLREEDQKSVFDLFQRHATSRGQSGSGLGLAIVREIAERHQGKAWVEKGNERGATFTISISKQLEALP